MAGICTSDVKAEELDSPHSSAVLLLLERINQGAKRMHRIVSHKRTNDRRQTYRIRSGDKEKFKDADQDLKNYI